MGFKPLLFSPLHVSTCAFLRSNKTVSTAMSSKQGWGKAGQKPGSHQQQQKCLHQHIRVVLHICVRLHNLIFTLTNTRVARQVLLQTRPALFDLQEQEGSERPHSTRVSAAEAAARTLTPAFRAATVNSHLRWSISGLYFLQGKNPKYLLGSLPYVRQTSEAVQSSSVFFLFY